MGACLGKGGPDPRVAPKKNDAESTMASQIQRNRKAKRMAVCGAQCDMEAIANYVPKVLRPAPPLLPPRLQTRRPFSLASAGHSRALSRGPRPVHGLLPWACALAPLVYKKGCPTLGAARPRVLSAPHHGQAHRPKRR